MSHTQRLVRDTLKRIRGIQLNSEWRWDDTELGQLKFFSLGGYPQTGHFQQRETQVFTPLLAD